MERQSPLKTLAECTVLVVGLGLMGASLALALKGKCARLYGVDIDLEVIQHALDFEVVEKAFTSLEEGPASVDMIILATPVGTILRLLHELDALFPNGAVLLDLGSTKHAIMEGMQALPPRFEVIGGHPICGKERGGIQNAEADLFLGAPFVLTPIRRTTLRAKTLAYALIEACGAHPCEVDADIHDRWLAMTSHLPYLLANGLCALTPPEVAMLIGPGFRSTTRLAPTPLNMMLDVIMSNRAYLLEALERFLVHMSEIKSHLEHEQTEALIVYLEEGIRQYQLFENRTVNAPPEIRFSDEIGI